MKKTRIRVDLDPSGKYSVFVSNKPMRWLLLKFYAFTVNFRADRPEGEQPAGKVVKVTASPEYDIDNTVKGGRVVRTAPKFFRKAKDGHSVDTSE